MSDEERKALLTVLHKLHCYFYVEEDKNPRLAKLGTDNALIEAIVVFGPKP